MKRRLPTDAAGDVVRRVVVAGSDRAVADPDRRRRIDAVRGESEVVVLAKARQVSVDERGAHVDRRRTLVVRGCAWMRSRTSSSCARWLSKLSFGEVLVIEESPGDFRAAKRSADGLAVVEGTDVVHRLPVGAQAGARDAPVRDQTAQHAGFSRGEQIVERQTVGTTARQFTHASGDLRHIFGCGRRRAHPAPDSMCARSSHRSRCRTTVGTGHATNGAQSAMIATCQISPISTVSPTRNLRVLEERAFSRLQGRHACAPWRSARFRVSSSSIRSRSPRTVKLGQYICVALFGVDPDRESVLAGRPLEQRHRAAQRRPAAVFRRHGGQPGGGRRRKGPGPLHRSRKSRRADPSRRSRCSMRTAPRRLICGTNSRCLRNWSTDEQKTRDVRRTAGGARTHAGRFSSSSRRRTSRPARSAGCIRSTRRSCARSMARRSRS